MKPTVNFAVQQGSFLLEALIGVVIFALGVLTMIALQANAIAVQSDAQYRIEASNLADQILGQINLNVARDALTGNVDQTDLLTFSHQPTGGTTQCRSGGADCCNFSGAASTNPIVTAWATALNTTAATRLPGSSASSQQITISTADSNRVSIVICWQGPKDVNPRFHRILAYVN